MMSKSSAFTDMNGHHGNSIGHGGAGLETQSEQIGGHNRYNTVQDFFKIEQENEELRDQLYEIQSSFTRTD